MGNAVRPSISATIITLNAGETLARTLESVEWVNEIVIVDSGSTDRTEALAREHGARFVVREWPGFGIQKQRAVDAAEGEWILSVDADEVVSDVLADSIRAAISTPEDHTGFRVACHTRFQGAWLGGKGWWTDWKLRVFRKDAGRFNELRIHEGVQLRGPSSDLEGPLYHRPWRDLSHRLEKDNRYSSLAARKDHREGRRAGTLTPYCRAAGWFLKEYLLRGAFLHGGAGLLHAGLTGAYAFARSAKLLELRWREREGLEENGPRRTDERPPGRP